MHQYTIFVLAFGLLATLLMSSTASAVPLIYCQPNAMKEMDPRTHPLCFALVEKVETQQEEGDVAESQPLYSRGAKRQDVDHVFLRFGRRMNL